MKRVIVLAVLVCGALCIVMTAPAFAARALGVHIEAVAPIDSVNVGSHPFVASGAAVDGGILPAEGLVSTGAITLSPSWGKGSAWILSVVKQFSCDAGTFDLELTIWITWITPDYGNDIGHWTVIGGTGTYANLKGNGTIRGTVDPVTLILSDVYDGRLKLD
jgi:hypothetical protein